MRPLPAICVVVLAFAGCAAPGDQPQTQADADNAAGMGAGGGEALVGFGQAPSLDAVWALPECRYMRLTINQDRETAAQGLPPDHELQGEGVATLALWAADCPAAVVGNVTVVEPFQYAVLYHILRAMSDDATQIDTFAREVVVSAPEAAAWLADTGLPVQVGRVAFSAPGEAYEVSVEAAGIGFVATGAKPVEEADPDSAGIGFRFRAGDDVRSTWLQDDVKLLSRTNLPAIALVQAEAGYLATAFPLGTAPARIEESYGASVLTAHIEIHG